MPEDQPEVMQLKDMVAMDWAARLRQLEDLHPRVHALENAVSDIRSDLREFTSEQKQQHKETQQALKDFLEQTRTEVKDRETATTTAISDLGKTVTGLARKFWFASGAVWVVLSLGGMAFYMREDLFTAVTIMGGLATGTVLIMILVPVLYAIFYRTSRPEVSHEWADARARAA